MGILKLPLFPVGDRDNGEYLVFLPGVETEEIEELAYETDEDMEEMRIHCIYGEEDGEPVGQTYSIEINDVNRDQVEDLEQLAVLNPSDMEPEELTEDPEGQDELARLFEHLKEIEEDFFDEEEVE